MKKPLRGASALLAISTLTVLIQGCDMTGGGWLFSAAGAPDMAQFGLKLGCEEGEDGEDVLKGHIVYHDKAYSTSRYDGVALEGEPLGGGCGSGSSSAVFTLTYEPQPRTAGDGGIAVLRITDGGEPGTGDDYFYLQILTGLYAGYQNQGYLQGGNLASH